MVDAVSVGSTMKACDLVIKDNDEGQEMTGGFSVTVLLQTLN